MKKSKAGRKSLPEGEKKVELRIFIKRNILEKVTIKDIENVQKLITEIVSSREENRKPQLKINT